MCQRDRQSHSGEEVDLTLREMQIGEHTQCRVIDSTGGTTATEHDFDDWPQQTGLICHTLSELRVIVYEGQQLCSIKQWRSRGINACRNRHATTHPHRLRPKLPAYSHREPRKTISGRTKPSAHRRYNQYHPHPPSVPRQRKFTLKFTPSDAEFQRR